MALENKSLVLDLLEWVAQDIRTYAEVMDAWRTSCPRLSIWEDAVDHGFVVRERGHDGVTRVLVTNKGRDLLVRNDRTYESEKIVSGT